MSDLLLGTIKQAAVDAVASSKPVAVSLGTVRSTAPVRIDVEQKLQLDESFLIWTETARSRELRPGDSLLLLRVQGGQQFVVLDRY